MTDKEKYIALWEREVDLLKLLPEIPSNSLEMQEIMKAENPEFNGLWALIIELIKNLFLSSTNEESISLWEKMLGVIPKVEESLEERQKRIKNLILYRLPYTERRLKQILDGQFGTDKTIQTLFYNDYALRLEVDRSIYHMREEIFSLVREIIPANLSLLMEFRKYVQHKITYGVVVAIRKRAKCITSISFDLNEARLIQAFVGIVSQRKRKKLRS